MRLRTHLFAAIAGAVLIGLTGCEASNAATADGATASPVAISAATGQGAGGSATKANAGGCPVSASKLQKVAGLSAGYKIKASSIECASGWATAAVTAPSAAQQGDGVILFKYDTAAKKWVKKDEGSSFDCSALGIPAGAARVLSACEQLKATAAPSRANAGGCPVSASALQKVAGLSAGYKIKASSIECASGWATAAVTAPTPAQQGDGVILFKYDNAAKKWTKKDEGSSFDCASNGIPKSTGFCSDEN